MPADSEGTRFITKQRKQKKELKLQIKEKKTREEITWKDSEDNQARPSCLEFLSIENACESSTKNSIRKNTRERVFFRRKKSLRRKKSRKERKEV